MGDFNHGHIQVKSLEGSWDEDQQFLFLTQDNSLTQHVLEATSGKKALYIVLTSENELVCIVEIREPLCNNGHTKYIFTSK